MKVNILLAGTLSLVLIAGFASPAFAQVTGIEANPPGGPISTNSLANPQHGLVDVSTLGMANTFCNGIQFDGSNHQRYIPNANNIVSVDIELITVSLASVNPITVNLYQGLGIGGPLLGSTSNDDGNFAAVGQPAQIVHFDFAGPIALVPGNPYTIEITLNDATSELFWTATFANPLPTPEDVE